MVVDKLAYATMSWNEIARAALQSIIEQHGGLVAVVAFQAISNIVLLFIILPIAWYIIRLKQKEMNRIAMEKKKLEEQILKKRYTSSPKPGKGK